MLMLPQSFLQDRVLTLSPAPGLSSPPPSPHICPIHLCLSVHPLLGGPSPSLLQAPRGGGKVGELQRGCWGREGRGLQLPRRPADGLGGPPLRRQLPQFGTPGGVQEILGRVRCSWAGKKGKCGYVASRETPVRELTKLPSFYS